MGAGTDRISVKTMGSVRVWESMRSVGASKTAQNMAHEKEKKAEYSEDTVHLRARNIKSNNSYEDDCIILCIKLSQAHFLYRIKILIYHMK